MNGKEAISTPQVEAGDIGALTKLAATQTGDTLCDRDALIQLPGVDFPSSVISYAIHPTREGDDEKLMTSLTRMSEEDPTFRIERNEVTKQLLISGLGDLHININRERMADKFGVETAVSPPKCRIGKQFVGESKAPKVDTNANPVDEVSSAMSRLISLPCNEARALNLLTTLLVAQFRATISSCRKRHPRENGQRFTCWLPRRRYPNRSL